MVILFVLRPFSRIFIKIASFCNIPFRFCAVFYESTHAHYNYKTTITITKLQLQIQKHTTIL